MADPDYDQLIVEGPAVIDGTLEVSLIEGFTPELGNAFDLLTATDDISGRFSAANYPELAPGLTWDLDYGTNEITLEVVDVMLGDMDGDGSLTQDDIGLFVLALVHPTDYEAQFPMLQRIALGDVNLDGLFDLSDMGAFRVFSFGVGSAASQSVPEPGSLALLAMLCIGFMGQRFLGLRFLGRRPRRAI